MALALVPALALEQSQATRGGTVVLYTHESLSDHQLFVCVALRLAFFFLRPFLALCVASSMSADVLSWLLLWLLPRVVVTSPPKTAVVLQNGTKLVLQDFYMPNASQ